MAYEYKEPDVVETHTREFIVDRDAGTATGAIFGIILAAIVVFGLVGYFAWWGPSSAPSTTNVRIETPADTGRAQDIHVDAPDVNVTTPPPIINNPPATDNSNRADMGTTGSDSDLGTTGAQGDTGTGTSESQ